MIGKIIVALALSAVAANACPLSSYGFGGSYGLFPGCGLGYPDTAAALASYSAAVPPYVSSIAGFPGLLPSYGVSSCLPNAIAAPFFPASPISYPATTCGLIC